LAADRVKVVALDADPTAAFARWAKNTYEGPAFTSFAEADEARLAHLIDAENRAADLVLVDTAGFGNRAAAVAMTSADAVLIPTLAGEADITEAEKTVRLVEGLARAARRDNAGRSRGLRRNDVLGPGAGSGPGGRGTGAVGRGTEGTRLGA
jgi:chromosome partitioning protein